MIKYLDYLPILMIIEAVLAAGLLFWCKRWGSGVYWLAAAMLNFAVVFLIRRWG